MATRTYLDKPSLWTVIITAILIVFILVTGILVWIFTKEIVSRIILIILICVECILGISVLTYLEIRRKKVQKENTKLSSVTKSDYKYNQVKPSAPTYPTVDYTNRSTLQA
ncbi:hypothetical protein GWI33_010757 [Rhynchophorus ferrugineus]|uniref:Uncharacterized protein n=1 Tax=Rhynchophorus ferrugineus TaxID=354439 RepID=A0A834MJC5_RHYFE|nr:hypothetical protein GWI33_010757 [Rhynchophorus ferrugineus]